MSSRIVYSNSRRGYYSFCYRRSFFDLQGLRVKVEPIYFLVGRIFHNVLEEIYKYPGTLHRDQLSDWFAIHKTKEEVTNPEMFPDEIHKREKAVDLIYDILHANYGVFVEQKSRYEFLALEVPIRMSLAKRGPKYFLRYIPLDSPKRPLNEFVQVIDGFAYDRESKRDVVFEHKTTAELLGGYEPGLKYNWQSIGNTLGGRLFLEAHGRPGLKSIVYNVFRKKAPTKPTGIQCKPCKGTGSRKGKVCRICKGTGVGGMSSNSGETTSLLIDKFMDDHSFLRDTIWYDKSYNEVRTKLLNRSHPYHLQTEKLLSGSKALQFIEDTYVVFTDMRQRMKHPDRWFRNLSPDCKKCGYRYLCFDDNPLLRSQYYNVITEDTEYPYEFQKHQANFLKGGFCNV